MNMHFETPALIALANIQSAAIDSGQLDHTGELAAKDLFNRICNELEDRGVVVSDYVVCPENL